MLDQSVILQKSCRNNGAALVEPSVLKWVVMNEEWLGTLSFVAVPSHGTVRLAGYISSAEMLDVGQVYHTGLTSLWRLVSTTDIGW